MMIQRDSISRCCVALLLLSGCADPAPNPALVKLSSACDAGDTKACAAVLDYQQRQAAGLAALTAGMHQPVDPTPFLTQPRPQPALGPGMKVCWDGRIVPVNFFC